MDKQTLYDIMQNLQRSNVINLDVKVSELIEAVRKTGAMKSADDGGGSDLHIACCNEYALVTK